MTEEAAEEAREVVLTPGHEPNCCCPRCVAEINRIAAMAINSLTDHEVLELMAMRFGAMHATLVLLTPTEADPSMGQLSHFTSACDQQTEMMLHGALMGVRAKLVQKATREAMMKDPNIQ